MYCSLHAYQKFLISFTSNDLGKEIKQITHGALTDGQKEGKTAIFP